MSVLHVFDVFPILHAANNVPALASEFSRDCPVGGAKLLLRKISHILTNGEDVVCAFDSKSEKSIKCSYYKKGRKRVPEVMLQSELLYKFLTNAGVTCIKVNGLEADDIIYNVVNQSLKDYYTIYMYSSDYDLCHNIFKDRVQLRAVTQLSLNVHIGNFSDVLSRDKIRIPYNMITAFKVFCGDKSDEIPAFVSHDGINGRVFFNKLVDMAFSLDKPLPFKVLRSKELILKLAPLMGLNEEDIKVLKERCYLFYPIEKELDFIPTNIRSVNLNYYKQFVKAIGDKDSCTSLKCWDVDSKKLEQEIYEYGKAYKSGEYHVDNNLSLQELEIKNSSVFIRGL